MSSCYPNVILSRIRICFLKTRNSEILSELEVVALPHKLSLYTAFNAYTSKIRGQKGY